MSGKKGGRQPGSKANKPIKKAKPKKKGFKGKRTSDSPKAGYGRNSGPGKPARSSSSSKPSYGRSSDSERSEGSTRKTYTKKSYGRKPDSARPSYGRKSDTSKPSYGRSSDSERSEGSGRKPYSKPSYGRSSDSARPSYSRSSDSERSDSSTRKPHGKFTYGRKSDSDRPSSGRSSDSGKPSYGRSSDSDRRESGGRKPYGKPKYSLSSDYWKPNFGQSSDSDRPSYGRKSDSGKPSYGRRSDSDRPRGPPRHGGGRSQGGSYGGRGQSESSSLPDVEGLITIEGKLATKNSTPGYRVYDERLVKRGRSEYRIWDPHRSKVAAALAKGLRDLPINPSSQVLYLGASSGTTASHIADLAGTVWCVEFSKRMMRELIVVCEHKTNMVPILADARHPWEYSNTIGGVDLVIQDVAQPDQAQILINTQEEFGFDQALLSIKARSINSAADPRTIFEAESEKLLPKFSIVQKLDLTPFEEDHMLLHLVTSSHD